MKQALLFTSCFLLIALLAGCGLTERITKSRTVDIDTVRVPVPIPEHRFSEVFELQDSLVFEDERLRLSLGRVQPNTGVNDTMPDKKEIAAQEPTLWRINALLKSDTLQADVPQKTITDRTETTNFVRRTPGYIKYIIGGLVMLILVMVVAWKIKQ